MIELVYNLYYKYSIILNSKLISFKISTDLLDFPHLGLWYIVILSFINTPLYINNLIPLYLKQLELPFVLTKIEDTNAVIILINFL